jgi:glycosyltransferase involved in cell wall biosynthesis
MSEVSRPLHILWVAQWFPPDLGALPARITEMSRVWTEAGHRVTVVAAFPHHPLGVIPANYRGRFVVEETYEDLRVIRCWLWALPNRRLWQRTLCQISFTVSSVLFALFRPERPDVVIVSSPPFFTVPAGWAFSAVRRAPLVFEVRDLWPAVFVASGAMKEGLLYRVLESLEKLFYRAADRIVVVTNGFRDDLVARGVPKEKIDVVFNGADAVVYGAGSSGDAMRAELAPGGAEFLVTYVGTHGLLQGLEQVLDAADALRDDPRFAFAFVGEGARKAFLIEEARRRGLARVVFHDAVAKARVPEVYAASDACVVCLRPLPIFDKFIPSKVFETLAAARPIVAALSGEAAAIVREAGGGVAKPGDGASIAAALRELASRPAAERAAQGERGRRYIAERYDRRRLAREYLDVLTKMATVR